MPLSDLLKTFKNEKEGILDEMDRFLLYNRKGADIGRPYEERIEGWHHPSVLSSVSCDRAYIYGWIKAKKSNPSINAKGRKIFDCGNDYGYRKQGYLWCMDKLLGRWLCIECKHLWLDLENPSYRKCPECGSELEIWYNLQYLELPLFDYENNLCGHADLAFKHEGQIKIGEVKSIKNRGERQSYTPSFEDLNEPLVHHRIQLNCYLNMAKKECGKNERDFEKGIFIYGGKNNQEEKEFEIRRSIEDYQAVITRKEILDEYIKIFKLPERLCTNKNDWHGRFCDWKDTCWADIGFEELDRRVTDEE